METSRSQLDSGPILQIFPLAEKTSDSSDKSSEGLDRRGVELFYEEIEKMPRFKRGSRVVVRLVHQWPESAIQIRTKQPVILENWHNYTLTYDGSGKASGMRIYVDGKAVETETLQDNSKRNPPG